MADIDIAAARALCERTTPGPWVVGREVDGGVFFGTVTDPDDPSEPGILLGDAGSEVVEFIVAARTLVPALLDEIEQIGWSFLALLDALAASEARVRELEAEAADVADPSRTYVNGYRKALEWAADVVHAEARWQWERDLRRIPGSQIVAQRMGVIEQCLRDGIARGSDV